MNHGLSFPFYLIERILTYYGLLKLLIWATICIPTLLLSCVLLHSFDVFSIVPQCRKKSHSKENPMNECRNFLLVLQMHTYIYELIK